MQAPKNAAVAVVLAVLALAGIALALERALHSEQGVLIRQDPRAPWIQAATPFDGRIQQWGQSDAPPTRFSTEFELEKPVLPVTLELRAFGSFAVSVNDTVVATTPPSSAPVARAWREYSRLEIGRYLVPGRNRVQVEVANRRGPPLLSLRIEGAGLALATGPEWRAWTAARGQRAVWVASDTRRHPQASAGENPLTALRANTPLLLVLFIVGAGASYAWQRRRAKASARFTRRARTPAAVMLAVITLAWGALFLLSYVAIDRATGFDAGNHWLYLEQLLATHRVPLATDGWSMYHPPFFYALAAMAGKLGQALGGAAGFAVGAKLVPWLAGLGLAWLAAALAWRLLPEEPEVAVWAALFAGLLPLNLTLAAYFSNEGLHAVLAAGALLVAVDLLLARSVRRTRLALLSILLGLALLTKFTALLVAALVGGTVVAKLVAWERSEPRRLALDLAVLVLPAAILAGPFYLRNLLVFGSPLVGNWALPGADQVWWSTPGFHTPAYYLGFGESLVRPFFSALVSFPDALYSTFFGDGLLAGRANITSRHTHWNYSRMAAGMLLALPVAAALAAGLVLGLGRALQALERWRAFAFALCLAVCGGLAWAILYTTLAQPYFGQARASYGLAAVPALAVCFGLAATRLDRMLARAAGPGGRALLHGATTAIFGLFYLSFFA